MIILFVTESQGTKNIFRRLIHRKQIKIIYFSTIEAKDRIKCPISAGFLINKVPYWTNRTVHVLKWYDLRSELAIGHIIYYYISTVETWAWLPLHFSLSACQEQQDISLKTNHCGLSMKIWHLRCTGIMSDILSVGVHLVDRHDPLYGIIDIFVEFAEIVAMKSHNLSHRLLIYTNWRGDGRIRVALGRNYNLTRTAGCHCEGIGKSTAVRNHTDSCSNIWFYTADCRSSYVVVYFGENTFSYLRTSNTPDKNTYRIVRSDRIVSFIVRNKIFCNQW